MLGVNKLSINMDHFMQNENGINHQLEMGISRGGWWKHPPLEMGLIFRGGWWEHPPLENTRP